MLDQHFALYGLSEHGFLPKADTAIASSSFCLAFSHSFRDVGNERASTRICKCMYRIELYMMYDPSVSLEKID